MGEIKENTNLDNLSLKTSTLKLLENVTLVPQESPESHWATKL